MNLGVFDLALLVAYFAGMIAVGFVVGRRTSGAKDYFLGSRDLPCWALLLSIVATETSTVTFLSVPVTLLVIATLAALVPARKAMRIDPLAALRID